MKRWVGFGVIADNLIHIADHMANSDKAWDPPPLSRIPAPATPKNDPQTVTARPHHQIHSRSRSQPIASQPARDAVSTDARILRRKVAKSQTDSTRGVQPTSGKLRPVRTNARVIDWQNFD
jgi:hypothetical protein